MATFATSGRFWRHFASGSGVAACTGVWYWAIAASGKVAGTESTSETADDRLGKMGAATFPASPSFKLATSTSGKRQTMEKLVLDLQQAIVDEIEDIDGTKFHVDLWQRAKGGGGRSCVMENGNVIEKAGVMVSVFHGVASKNLLRQMQSRHEALAGYDQLPFYACGISVIMHPHNPMAPTVHFNYRLLELQLPEKDEDGNHKTVWWHGGGADLTPSYLFPEDAIHFHRQLKDACDKHNPALYDRYKEWCDKYFYVAHRKEGRGVGGIFFDELQDSPDCPDATAFVQSCADAFLPSYAPILRKRKDMPYTEEQKRWQQIRRGRYVEFNLVHDRGTKFGLHTDGARIESVLASMPMTARWEYCHEPEAGSPEAELVEVLRNPVDWIKLDEDNKRGGSK